MPSRPGGRPWLSISRQYSPRPMASCRMPAAPCIAVRPAPTMSDRTSSLQGEHRATTFKPASHMAQPHETCCACALGLQEAQKPAQFSICQGVCRGGRSTFGGEVKGGGGPPGPVAPVDGALPVRVLVWQGGSEWTPLCYTPLFRLSRNPDTSITASASSKPGPFIQQCATPVRVVAIQHVTAASGGLQQHL